MCGTYSYQVIVEDEHGEMVACNFDLFVDTEAPVIVYCPNDTTALWGGVITGEFIADDPDDCPFDLEYSLCGATDTYPGTFTIDPDNGDWQWITAEDPAFYGVWEICLEASDGCKSVQCIFNITILPTYSIVIEKVHDQYQGHYAYVSIVWENNPTDRGGFDFLI
jgi:hypothetical protein